MIVPQRGFPLLFHIAKAAFSLIFQAERRFLLLCV